MVTESVLARKGKKPRGNEERSCPEASYPSRRALEPINITMPMVLVGVGQPIFRPTGAK
jgi:hypothetical protein